MMKFSSIFVYAELYQKVLSENVGNQTIRFIVGHLHCNKINP